MDASLVKIRHERSKKDFPQLGLEEGEYVELVFSRAKICLMMIWWAVAFGLIVVLIAFIFALLGQESLNAIGKQFIFVIISSALTAIIIFGLVATIIFHSNKLYITNRRAIQFIMRTPVVTSNNFIDLFSIEDVSFRQENILQKLFHYGTIRLSTVGDETTYIFTQAKDPKNEINVITNLVRQAKDLRASQITKS